MADVSGKGIAAALLMSNIQATLHSLINYTHNLKDITIELNKRVIDNTKSEKFVSLFIAKLNTKSQQFSYINAGHNPPIMFYENRFTELNKGCTILGINQTLKIEVATFDYSSIFTLVCYTDGLTDTFNPANEQLSVENVKEIIQNNHTKDPEELNEIIISFAEEFKAENEFTDDIALLTLKVDDVNF
jgi:sigma-B regulation protein RsbU (phosphoserine phosphatase)